MRHTANGKLVLSEVTVAEITEKSLRNVKAHGPDFIPNIVLRIAMSVKPEIFADFFNSCPRDGTFSTRWKAQKLLLLGKPGKPPEGLSSYRPTCLPDTVGKVLEKIILTRLGLAVEQAGGLSPEQFGFRKGKSTVNTIETVTSIAANAIEGSI